MQLNAESSVDIDLRDQDRNNIYQYKSCVVHCGRKKFIISQRTKGNPAKLDKDEYLIVSSTLLRSKFIER